MTSANWREKPRKAPSLLRGSIIHTRVRQPVKEWVETQAQQFGGESLFVSHLIEQAMNSDMRKKAREAKNATDNQSNVS
jgi:hypothetical protein